MSSEHPRVAVITGSSRGIGRAIAESLGAAGYAVVLNARDDGKELQGSVDALTKIALAKACAADVSDYDAAQRLIQFARDEFGRIDILVNNAGITRDKMFHRMKPSEWQEVIGTNLLGVINCSHAVIGHMRERRTGRIVNIASVIAQTGNVGQTNYAASKAGIIGFTRSLAREVAGLGVTVNAVCPGFVNTEMVEAMPEEQRARVVAGIPAGRLGLPREVAAMVAFLCSDEAQYVTGQSVNVNGGLFM